MNAHPRIELCRQLAAIADMLEQGNATGGTPPQAPQIRQSLRWMRNLPHIDQELEQWLQTATPEEQQARVKSLLELIQLYAAQWQHSNTLRDDPIVTEANDAVSAMALAIIEHAAESYPNQAELESLLSHLPKRSHLRVTQSVERLVALLAAAIERLSGHADERTPVDRMADASKRIHITAKKLQSIEAMEPPAREESIELAREILRRLRDMTMGKTDKTSGIDTGKPEVKARLAEKIDEMLDMYKNLVFEALQVSAGLITDPIIKAANDAAATFDHAIKLMAAKEMPGSMAATQQISAADAAQATMDGHTMDRLLKSLAAGIDQAAGILEQEQEQSHQKQEEAGQEQAAEAAAQAANQSRRRRRRRSRSGAGGAKQQKALRDLTADDFVLKQGRFSEPKGQERPAALAGLKMEDLAAIRQLGTSLSAFGQEASTLAPPAPAEPALTDTVKPDNKGFADRNKDDKTRKSNRPNKQGPRV